MRRQDRRLAGGLAVMGLCMLLFGGGLFGTIIRTAIRVTDWVVEQTQPPPQPVAPAPVPAPAPMVCHDSPGAA